MKDILLNMNWYKKILSQTYQEVMEDPEHYSDLDNPDYFEASRYFSIGQNDDEEYDSYCWIFDGRKMHIKKGGTHGMNFPNLFSWKKEDDINMYRGWYDPEQKLISVVIPRQIGRTEQALQPESLPTKLRVALSDSFGTNNKIVVF